MSPKLRIYTIAEIAPARSETSTRYTYFRIFRITAQNPDRAWDIFYSRAREIPGRIYKLIYNPLPNKALNCEIIDI
jgi:hypothetical protein